MIKKNVFAPWFSAIVTVGLAAGCSSAETGQSAASATSNTVVHIAATATHPAYHHACNRPAAPGIAQCHALIRDEDHEVNRARPFDDSALTAADLQSAYQLPTSGGNGKTVAIIEAFDYPNAESDLAVYRQQNGLPDCTAANGCFKKVNQNGQTSNYPAADTEGWNEEAALDMDMVSAACPDCKILMVEADDETNDDLGTANNTAVKLGAVAISNSWGTNEDPTVTQQDEEYYNHPAVSIFASSGDDGFETQGDPDNAPSYPAVSKYVVAVGGTSLSHSTNQANVRGWTETAWGDGGAGCSQYISKPSFQNGINTGCNNRAISDVSAAGDIQISIYCSADDAGGWNVVGGTSVSSPLVAAIYTLTGHAATDNSFAYSNPSDFFDVTSGNDGTCTNPIQCNASKGWDGPTGVGSPNGAALAQH